MAGSSLYGASRPQVLDLSGGISELRQDDPRMLANSRQLRLGFGDAFDVKRGTQDVDRAITVRDSDAEETVPLQHLGMLKDIGDIIEPAVGDGSSLELCLCFFSGEPGEGSFDLRFQFSAVCEALLVGHESRIVSQPGHTEHIGAQAAPLAVVLHSKNHLAAIADAIRTVGDDAGVTVAGALRVRPVRSHEAEGAHPFHEGIEQADADGGALTRGLATVEGREDGAKGVHAAGDIGDGDAGLRGLFG